MRCTGLYLPGCLRKSPFLPARKSDVCMQNYGAESHHAMLSDTILHLKALGERELATAPQLLEGDLHGQRALHGVRPNAKLARVELLIR